MGRTRKPSAMKLLALIAVGGAAWAMWKRRSPDGQTSPTAEPIHRPRPELTPEEAPPPESHRDEQTGGERVSTPPSNGDRSSGADTPAVSELAQESQADDVDEPASTQDQKETPGSSPDPVEEAEFESFPASDPPSWTR